MDDLLREFLTETSESLDVVDVELVRFEQEPNNTWILGNIFRLVHTIKGTCGFLVLPRLEALTHAAEALLGNFRDGVPVTRDAVSLILATIDRIKQVLDDLERYQAESPGHDRDLIDRLEQMSVELGARRPLPPADEAFDRPFDNLSDPDDVAAHTGATQPARAAAIEAAADVDERGDAKGADRSIRVHLDTLEQWMTMVSELVLTRNQLVEIGRRHNDSEFKGPLQRLSNITAELQEGVLKTRMQPIGNAWQKLPRIVRDLSSELGKQIDLEMYGAETELDRLVLDAIRDPLTHMVRNSADHGFETAAERRAAGKPECGRIRLSACHEGGSILIEVSDDGRGLDTARIRATALACGLATEAELAQLTDAQVHKFIFQPGVSTASRITKVSGRGIGMDVVRANIERIGGSIEVRSTAGAGTSFLIKIPLTLAIVPALIVAAGGGRFAIPQLAVVELVRVRPDAKHRIERIKDACILRLRDKLLPLVGLKALLGLDDGTPFDAEHGYVVVTQAGGQVFGIVVDAVLETEDIVVKPLSSRLRQIPVFSGNTILGDGSVILILDPNGVAQASGVDATDVATDAAREISTEAPQARTESLLLFRAGSPRPKAVPLSLITRLEMIDAENIEMSAGRPLLQYRGQVMPLVPAAETIDVRASGRQPLLVVSCGGRSMALLVDEIVDIVESDLDIELSSARPGVIGTAIVEQQATEVVDLGHFLALAFEDWHGWDDEAGKSATPRQVLLIDDTAFFRNMLVPVLKAAGYVVTAAASASEALALLGAGRRFDVIITDIEMPGMDGFELALAVQALPPAAGVPIIGLSTMVSAEAIARGREVGLDDYVAKFDRQGLIAAIKEKTSAFGRAA